MAILPSYSDSCAHYQRLRQEVTRFVIIGLIATATDFFLYCLFNFFLSFAVAKALSFFIGSIVAYLLNRTFTFQRQQHSIIEMARFAALYTGSLMANVAINSLIILSFNDSVFSFWNVSSSFIFVLAFFMATTASTILNFLGQKFWVFKSS